MSAASSRCNRRGHQCRRVSGRASSAEPGQANIGKKGPASQRPRSGDTRLVKLIYSRPLAIALGLIVLAACGCSNLAPTRDPGPSHSPSANATRNNLATGAPTVAPTATDIAGQWGPLAVAVEPAVFMEGVGTGRVELTASCALLHVGQTEWLLLWPRARTGWDSDARVVRYRTRSGLLLPISNGMTISAVGGNPNFDRDWIDSIDWTHPPAPECPADDPWWVQDVRIPPEAVGETE